MKLKTYSLLCLLFSLSALNAQDCELPVLSEIYDYNSAGFTLEWLDFNSAPDYWDIEFGTKGFQRDFIPEITNIPDQIYTFSNLQSGTTYELYLRTVCSSDISNWNGPYFINTAINNTSDCNLDLVIPDNNCDIGRDFRIEVDHSGPDVLGSDLILEKVELIIAHPWPPDVSIKLISPEGKSVNLSSFNGNGTDNYGDPDAGDCSNPAQFSDNACASIQDVNPPFIGEFKPQESFVSLFTGSPANGIWKLNICDRASGDLGTLTHARLIFSEEACVVPQSFRITDIEADNITVKWNAEFDCQNLQISYKVMGAPDSEISSDFVFCNSGEFTITELIPDTDYELYIVAICDQDSNSPRSCLYTFTTNCENANQISNFDILAECNTRCDDNCLINDIWTNSQGNVSNWLINSGPTPTDQTGPDNDKSQAGNYIYIENQKNTCPGDLFISLESTCLTNLNNIDCSIIFDYHMHGEDIGQLLLQYRKNESTWSTIWSKNGDQGNQWQTARVKVSDLFQYGNLRFVAQSKSDALRGDIALDNIKLAGMDTISQNIFYIDTDDDGFGSDSIVISNCSVLIPDGYADNSFDCDDSNATINPASQETPCNNIDENCNGNADDVSSSDINYIVTRINNESCKGESDGLIEISVNQGTPPFDINWSNGMNGSTIQGLSSGIYYATISDNAGCQLVSEPIIVDFEEILLYNINQILNPTCLGINTGVISINVGGGLLPYNIQWNNGLSGNIISGLSGGEYQATITDITGCQIITDPILLVNPKVVTAGVAQKRDIDCFNQSTGFISLGIAGGIAPYDIVWSNGNTTSAISQLPAGSYTVTVTDNLGCVDIVSDIVINQPDPLEIVVNNIEGISCFNDNAGQVDIDVKGGMPPYSYFWSSGHFTQDLFNVKAGTYNVTVTDFNACTKAFSNIIVAQNPQISVTLDSIVSANCQGSEEGYIGVNVNGGSPPYNYNWSTDDGNATNDSFIDNLLPGKYFLTVVDNLSCKSKTASFEILNLNTPINIQLEVIDSLLCFNYANAAISANALRGEPPFDFNWSIGLNSINGSGRDTIENLSKGSFNVTVTDSEGCVGVSDSIQITSPDDIEFDVTNIQNNICLEDNEGLIQIEVTGGTQPYQVLWNNGMTGVSINNLDNGFYQATVTDRNNCIDTLDEILISTPSPLSLVVETQDPTNGNSGVITVFPTGGMEPYMFDWGDPLDFLDGSVASNLSAGNYSVTIIDANDCTADTTLQLVTVSNDELQPFNLLLFPVPADDILYLESENSQPIIELSIFNLYGESIKNISSGINQNRWMINTKNIATGVYLLAIKFEGNQTVIRKFSVFH